ncbi:MAG TPA: hypothetical protein VE401_03170 [Solirubrobacterales bacterium]|jgi:hypothetical protein|nr:hypothetical protein [Solirubrobacterales bacterium]
MQDLQQAREGSIGTVARPGALVRRLGVGVPAALVAAALLPGLAAPSAHAAKTSVVAWEGDLAPGGVRAGVRVDPDGDAKLLTGAGGKVKVVNSFKIGGPALNAIQDAAKSALTGKQSAIDPMYEGWYAAAVVEVGGKTRALLGRNKLPPKLEQLLAAINAAVPLSKATKAERRSLGRPLAETASAPPIVEPLTPCAEGESATTFAREVSLEQAAQLGIVKLTSKGGFGGDDMAVDAQYKDVPLPTVVRLNIEVVSDQPGISSAFESHVEKELAGYVINQGKLKGQPVKFDLNVVRRSPGEPGRACFHQVRFTPGVHEHLKFDFNFMIGGGELVPTDPSGWTHNVLHLARLPDRYDWFFTPEGSKNPIKLPTTIMEFEAAIASLENLGVATNTGLAGVLRTHKGWKGNIMSPRPFVFGEFQFGEKLFQADLLFFAKLAQDRIVIHSEPGDLLLNKATGEQNLVNGASVDLILNKGDPPIHVDGMVVYCVDLDRGVPDPGAVFDVLGPAAEQPDPAMQALARVMKIVAHRQPGVLESTPGAQSAIWRITDDRVASVQSAQEILAEAGIPPDADYDAPHFGNPNSGSPNTGAVTPSSVLPPLELGPPLPLLKPLKPKLRDVSVRPRRVRAKRKVIVSVRLKLAKGLGDRVALSLERRKGRRFKRVRKLGRDRVPDDISTITLLLPKLKAGTYRVQAKASRGKPRYAKLNARR